MNIILLALIIYFGVGVCTLVIFDILTHRVRSRLYLASLDTQNRMVATGNYIGNRSSKILIILALWIFWPIAIYGALSSSKGDKVDG